MDRSHKVMGLPHKEVGRPHNEVDDRRSKELGRREEGGKIAQSEREKHCIVLGHVNLQPEDNFKT
jgi:hypothetical protein